MSAIQVRFEDNDILFFNWNEDEKYLVGKLEAALETKATKRRFLVFVKRMEFVVEGEVVPLFIDEDGRAHIEVRKSSASVRQNVVDRIKQSCNFTEA